MLQSTHTHTTDPCPHTQAQRKRQESFYFLHKYFASFFFSTEIQISCSQEGSGLISKFQEWNAIDTARLRVNHYVGSVEQFLGRGEGDARRTAAEYETLRLHFHNDSCSDRNMHTWVDRFLRMILDDEQLEHQGAVLSSREEMLRQLLRVDVE